MKVYSYTNYPKLDLLIDPLIGDACLPRKTLYLRSWNSSWLVPISF